MKAYLSRSAVAVIAFSTLLGAFTAFSWPRSERGADFWVYYTAASLVRRNMSVQSYEGCAPHLNPQLRLADESTTYARTARDHGIPKVMLYVYPPTLANMTVPLTVLPPRWALALVRLLDLVMIAVISVVLTRMMGQRSFALAALVAIAILLFRPTLNSLHWGQISVLLTFLMIAGLGFYLKGHRSIAAGMFVLAMAIKIVPVIVILPLIAWRDWKTLRAFAVWTIAMIASLWAINGGDALGVFVFQRLSAMSSGDLGTGAFVTNRSLGNVFYRYLDGATPVISSAALGIIVKAVTIVLLAVAAWLTRCKDYENLSGKEKSEVVVIFMLLACCLSPYSWLYAWVLSAPVLVVYCKKAWDQRTTATETVLLLLFALSLLTSKFNMPLLTPLLGIAFAFVVLNRLRLERQMKSGEQLGMLSA